MVPLKQIQSLRPHYQLPLKVLVEQKPLPFRLDENCRCNRTPVVLNHDVGNRQHSATVSAHLAMNKRSARRLSSIFDDFRNLVEVLHYVILIVILSVELNVTSNSVAVE